MRAASYCWSFARFVANWTISRMVSDSHRRPFFREEFRLLNYRVGCFLCFVRWISVLPEDLAHVVGHGHFGVVRAWAFWGC